MGHRLSILKAIYKLKVEQGIEVGVEDWRPVELQGGGGQGQPGGISGVGSGGMMQPGRQSSISSQYAPSFSNGSHISIGTTGTSTTGTGGGGIGTGQGGGGHPLQGTTQSQRFLHSQAGSEGGYSPTSTVDPAVAERIWDIVVEQSEFESPFFFSIFLASSVTSDNIRLLEYVR